MPRFDAVILDLGGVVVEVAGMTTLLSWAPGIPDEPSLWVRWLASPSVRAFETGRMGPESFANGVCAEFSLRVGPQEFLASFPGWITGLLPGAHTLLDDLGCAGIVLASLSNNNLLHWSRMTEEFGLGPRFAQHFPSHLTGRIKPDPTTFEAAVTALGLKPDRILFLDDNQPNVEGARDAGLCAERTRGPAEARAALIAHGVLSGAPG